MSRLEDAISIAPYIRSIAADVRGNGADDVYVCDVVCEDVYVRS